jgi:hypothetical protein
VRTTLRIGLAVLLSIAVGCTVGDRPARPPSASRTTTTATSADATARLRRPLRLPILTPGTPCPVARAHQVDPAFAEVLGDGPAYPTDSARVWRQGRVEGGWYYAKVLWVASPAHPGPFLVRGRQLDGPRQVRFGEGPQPDAGLLLPAGGTAHTSGSDWFNWPSYSRLRGGGCYAYQVDGAGGSRVVVFRA